jgi:hypothetical protein
MVTTNKNLLITTPIILILLRVIRSIITKMLSRRTKMTDCDQFYNFFKAVTQKACRT